MEKQDKTQMKETKTWPEIGMGLYDELNKRNAEITYEFDNLNVQVPSKVGSDAEHAEWKLDGSIRVRTKEHE
jgi:hypothetical protein